MTARRKGTGGRSAAPDAADAEADPLDRYRSMRDFSRTQEPSGAVAGRDDLDGSGDSTVGIFVVQRHRARRLHYDLRLEMGGVLVSWAVPKGPTLDPEVKRLAVHVEDHPLDYAEFEGVIPAGQYGGGDVIVWDAGRWSHGRKGDPRRALDQGELHVDLFGTKLTGRFVLVRRGRGDKDWLLFHKRDEHAVAGWDAEDHPASVRSGRTNEEVAADPDAVWHSNRAAAGPRAPRQRAPRQPAPAWAPLRPEEAAELDGLGPRGGELAIGGRTIEVTNLDKVLFPAGLGEPDHTKRDLIRYYATVAPVLLPYLEGRALNVRRFPDGVTHKGFWHKAVPSYAPAWLTRWDNPDADPGETRTYAVADRTASLAWLANNGAVELNPWTSRTAAHLEPTWALIDIDPGTETTFEDVLVLARLYRTALDHLHVEARPKVTGHRGIQIWVPIAPGYDFSQTRDWVETVSRAVGETVPDLVSWRWVVKERGGLARLDDTQNAINKTLVAPYSVRPAPGAPVSVPLEWDELDDPDLAPDRWTITSVLDRLVDVGDPFAALLGVEQRLPDL